CMGSGLRESDPAAFPQENGTPRSTTAKSASTSASRAYAAGKGARCGRSALFARTFCCPWSERGGKLLRENQRRRALSREGAREGIGEDGANVLGAIAQAGQRDRRVERVAEARGERGVQAPLVDEARERGHAGDGERDVERLGALPGRPALRERARDEALNVE